nr:NlpC/P60 family protein [Nakamurella flavida]
MAKLEATRNAKANLDSAARAAVDEAQAAQARADQAKATADAAQQSAAAAYQDGQDQLAALQAQLGRQQAEYDAALAFAGTLQGQREEYNQWLAAKIAEEEAARKAAEEAARVAAEEAARKAAEEEAARQAAEAARVAAEQAAAEQAARDAAAAAAQAAADRQAAAERAAAEQRAADAQQAAQLAASRAAAAASAAAAAAAASAPSPTYFDTCDDARDAGAAPMNRGEDGYRNALDPNGNGVACEGQASSAPASSGSGSSGGGSTAPVATAPVSSASSSSRGQRVVEAAKQWLGTTYAWGGGTASGPSRGIRDGGVADSYGDYNKIGFDCSGLALYAWAQVGVSLPHYSGYQYNSGTRISQSALQPGDLVFYARNTSDPSTIHHVAIYIGGGQVIEAPNSGSVVRIATMRTSGYIGAVRPG